MKKCSKCGSVISDNDKMAWKCTECGKAFSVNLSKLKKLQMLKNKPENTGKSLLKCSVCGNGLDNGSEMIACKCSACGNIMSGSLGDFADGDSYHKLNTDKISPSENMPPTLIKCPDCNKFVSNKATRCPNCGVNIHELEMYNKKEKLNSKIKKLGLLITVSLFLLIGIISVHSQYKNKLFEGYIDSFIHDWDRMAEASSKTPKDYLAVDIYERALCRDMKKISQSYIKFNNKSKINEYINSHAYRNMFEYTMKLIEQNGREYSIDKEFISFYSKMDR